MVLLANTIVETCAMAHRESRLSGRSPAMAKLRGIRRVLTEVRQAPFCRDAGLLSAKGVDQVLVTRGGRKITVGPSSLQQSVRRVNSIGVGMPDVQLTEVPSVRC